MSEIGYFGDREYVITEKEPKRPLMNYIWNARILAGVNHFGGGNGAYGDRALSYIDPQGKGRCCVIADGKRYFYVKNKTADTVFNPGWYPLKTPVEHFRCVHGLGYTTVSSECAGIAARLQVFVNREDPCEIWTVLLENRADHAQELSLYSFAEFSLEGYARYSDYNSYVHAEYDAADNLLMCFNAAMEKPHEWFNAFVSSDRKPAAFESSRSRFYGTYGSVFAPDSLKSEKLSDTLASCERMVGALQHDVTLAAGETVTFHVLIGVADKLDTAKSISKKLFQTGKIESDYAALKTETEKLCQSVTVSTPVEKVNNFANYWLKQQVQLCAEVGRDTGKGFRDQLQDAWAVSAFNPKLAAEKILETLSYMYADGRCVRGWLPLDHHIYSDGPIWIPLSVNAYLKETGDYGFLDKEVTYLDGEKDTVWEHILTAMRFASDDVGKHGLVHSRDGDWNDSLNMTGLQGRGESVWKSIALCLALRNTAEMAKHIRKDASLSDEMLQRAEKMEMAVNKEGWDGKWFLAAINDYDEKVGSHEEKEGKIYLNPQTWAIYAGIVDDERTRLCLDAVDTYLDSDYGPLTLYPAYKKFNDHIGRLTSFIPGIWENGTPYCHGGTFKIVADCICGRGNAAFETMMKILPNSATNPTAHSGCEPYVVTNMYYGPENPRKGETMFAWVTGTAGWMFRAITQYMLGFHPEYDGFHLAPCIPFDWKEVTMRRKYRLDEYDIVIENPNGRQSGIRELFVDGKKYETDSVKAFLDGKKHTIRIVM